MRAFLTSNRSLDMWRPGTASQSCDRALMAGPQQLMPTALYLTTVATGP